MRIFLAVAALALMFFACKICNLSVGSNGNDTNSNMAAATPAPAPTPAKASLKEAFPQKVGDFTLQDTYERSMLQGDDSFLPGATDMMGAVYKSSTNRKEQIMVGSYPSASAAGAARAKRVSTSKYLARWTKGNLLYVATDNFFKDKL